MKHRARLAKRRRGKPSIASRRKIASAAIKRRWRSAWRIEPLHTLGFGKSCAAITRERSSHDAQ